MAALSGYSALRSARLLGGISVCVFAFPIFFPAKAYAALVPEKNLQRAELLPFVPLLWKNEGLLFADILLQKLLLPFGLTSPYTNLFMTEAFRDIAANIAAVKAESGPRRLRGRRLQEDEEAAKETLRSFVRSLHAALRGNTFDINFADELIKHLPVGISGQIASVTEAFGKEVLRVLAEADNPASAIITHLLGPLDGGELPFFDFGGSEDAGLAEEGSESRRLQQIERAHSRQSEKGQRTEKTLIQEDENKVNTQRSLLEPREEKDNQEPFNEAVDPSEGRR